MISGLSTGERYELDGDWLVDTKTGEVVYDDVRGRAGELLCEKMNELARLEHNAEIYRERLALFDKFIHTSECSDEGGHFAYFTPPDDHGRDPFVLRVNQCESEAQALAELVQWAYDVLAENVKQEGD